MSILLISTSFFVSISQNWSLGQSRKGCAYRRRLTTAWIYVRRHASKYNDESLWELYVMQCITNDKRNVLNKEADIFDKGKDTSNKDICSSKRKTDTANKESHVYRIFTSLSHLVLSDPLGMSRPSGWGLFALITLISLVRRGSETRVSHQIEVYSKWVRSDMSASENVEPPETNFQSITHYKYNITNKVCEHGPERVFFFMEMIT